MPKRPFIGGGPELADFRHETGLEQDLEIGLREFLATQKKSWSNPRVEFWICGLHALPP